MEFKENVISKKENERVALQKRSEERNAFKKRLEEELGDKMPKGEGLSAITGRIILSQQDYNYCQGLYINGPYNTWCTGVDNNADPLKPINPNAKPDPNLRSKHYIDVKDAELFHEIYTNRREAEAEAAEKAREVADQEKKNEN